jgi:hypothetical protein
LAIDEHSGGRSDYIQAPVLSSEFVSYTELILMLVFLGQTLSLASWQKVDTPKAVMAEASG